MSERPATLLILAAALAAILVVIATVWNGTQMAEAWLAAYLFWIALPVGALFIVLAQRLTGGEWSAPIAPVLAAMLRMLPLMGVLLIPILVGLRDVYPWATGQPEGWLAPSGFIVRSIIYVALWNGILLLIPRDPLAGTAIVWPALILLFLSASLAAFDWIMTLEPLWTSTIFGLMITAEWALGSLAFAIAVLTIFDGDDPSAASKRDVLARLLLALIVLWAYLAAVQFVVVWESDLSAEIPWYLKRSTGGWFTAAIVVAVLQFLVPFLLLLWQPLRRARSALLFAACAVLIGHLVDVWWLTVPDFSAGFGWPEPLAFVAIGCFLAIVARTGISGSLLPLEARHDHG